MLTSCIRAAHYDFDPATGLVKPVSASDFPVNVLVEGKQYKPKVVALEDGGYMIIWGSQGGDGSGSAIYAQRYDAHDQKVGHEFLVNPTTDGNQGVGSDNRDLENLLGATLMADGNIFVTWQSDKIDGNGYGIEGTTIEIDAGYFSEFLVNTETLSDQQYSRTAALPDGQGFVVVYESNNGSGSILVQLFDAKGMPVGSEFKIDPTGSQDRPDVAVLANGLIQVTWQSQEGGSNAIKTQSFSYSLEGAVTGVAKQGGELLVNVNDAGNQESASITAMEGGGYMVSWLSSVGGKWVLVAREYGANGNPVTSDIQVANTGFADYSVQSRPMITTLSNGQVVMTYQKDGGGSASTDSYFRIYDPVTGTLGTEIKAHQVSNAIQGTPSVAALEDGRFIVTWDSYDNSGPDNSGSSIWGRVFEANGSPAADVMGGNEFMMNTSTAGGQKTAVTVATPDGKGFVTVFVSPDAAPGAGTGGIYAQYFTADGQKVGQQLQIHQLVAGEQFAPHLTFVGNKLFVTWTDQGVGDTSGAAVKGRLIDLEETLGLTLAPDDTPTTVDYDPVSNLHGTDGGDVLDARGYTDVKAGGGDDTIVINGSRFNSIDGGAGHDVLVWDSHTALDLASLSHKLSSIEALQLSNDVGQTVKIELSDVLSMTQPMAGVQRLFVNGDVGSSASGARDAVDIDLSAWAADASPVEERGVSYQVYTSTVDPTVQLLIQNGLHVF